MNGQGCELWTSIIKPVLLDERFYGRTKDRTDARKPAGVRRGRRSALPQSVSERHCVGRYEELSDKPEYIEVRRQAQSVLEKRAMWWQTGYAASQSRRGPKPVAPVFYCIHIEQLSGHKAIPDAVESPFFSRMSSEEDSPAC
jgi:hypothetical protein